MEMGRTTLSFSELARGCFTTLRPEPLMPLRAHGLERRRTSRAGRVCRRHWITMATVKLTSRSILEGLGIFLMAMGRSIKESGPEE